MAVVVTKSGGITNRDASPRVKMNASLMGGVLASAAGTVETTATDSIGSTYIMCQVPSNARVHQVLLYCDDIGTTGEADIGLYRTTADGSAVVDADFFASAVVLDSGALNAVDVTHEAAAGTGLNIDDVEKPLWSALGLTTDPRIMYDVVLTLTEAANAAGTLSLKVAYQF